MGSALLNTSNNTSNVALVSGISPTAGGVITVTIEPGPNNTSTSLFWYIGAMQVATSVPEPTSLLALGAAAPLFLRRRRV
jgi:hypothetical protein